MDTALITGASRGIGKSISELFYQRGVKVISPARSELDLGSNAGIDAYLRDIEGVDILVNCGGINELADIEGMSDDLIEKTLHINLISQMKLIRWAARSMRANRYGRIVNFSSIWSEMSKVGRIVYSVSKAGVNGMTRAAAVELAPYGILVNAIAPGFVNTDMTSRNNTPEQIEALARSLPIGRLAEPDEIAKLAYFLASRENSFVTGQIIFADGGFSCI